MPKHKDNSRYTVKEFIDELAKPKGTYIISIANHLTLVINKKLVDIWDCSRKSVGNYWYINDKSYTQKELDEMIQSNDKPKRKKKRIEL